MNDNDKMTIYQNLKDVGFYITKHTIGLKSASKQDAIKHLPKALYKIQNPLLPANENVKNSELECQGVKTIIPSNI